MRSGGDVVLLLDNNMSVFQAYKEGGGRPQFIVIDTDMSIVMKTSDKMNAENKVLELLD